MRIVFMGTPDFAVPSLEALPVAGHDLVAVVTRPDRPRRHGGATPEASPVRAAATRLGLPVLQPETMRDPAFVAALAGAAPEAVVVVAFGRILTPDILALPPRGCTNVHASLLPRYRGAAPIARAIMAGETGTGVTTMRMERGLDTGDILLERACAIEPGETTGELTARLAVIGADLLVETLAALASGTLAPRPQDHAAATWAPPLRRADGRLDWSADAAAVAGRILGCNPWPIAEAGLRGGRIQILRAVAEPGPGIGAPAPAGTVLEAAGERIVVACAPASRLRILTLRLPGRRAQSARDAINGRMVRQGDLFTPPPEG
jgi:methionyl-tRNA formyltransferase